MEPSLTKNMGDYVKPDMTVLDCNGKEIGHVDHLEELNGQTVIKLKRLDPQAHGVHRLLPVTLLQKLVDEKTIQLNKSEDEINRIAKEMVGSSGSMQQTELPRTTTAQ